MPRALRTDGAALSALVFVLLAATGCAARGASADLLTATRFGVEAEVDPASLEEHPRGFYFREIELGAGAAAAPGRWVHIAYVVRLASGQEVDRADPGSAVRLRLGEAALIPALDAALREMRAGGTRQLVVPPRLGYGSRGAGAVPPNAVLVMVVTLLRVE